MPPLCARTSPGGTWGWHPAGSAGTGVSHRDPTRGRWLLLQHPRAVSSSPRRARFQFPWCRRWLPWRSPGAAFAAQPGRSRPTPRLRPPAAGGDGEISPRAVGGRRRRGPLPSPNVTRCEKLETAAGCPVAAGGSQGHGGERSGGGSPGTAALGHCRFATPSKNAGRHAVPPGRRERGAPGASFACSNAFC